MGPTNPKIALTFEKLNDLAARLYARATEVEVRVTLVDLAADLRLGALACVRLADTRQRIAEIAEKALIYDGAAISRDLRELLEEGSDAD
jgi:hypothetical protein